MKKDDIEDHWKPYPEIVDGGGGTYEIIDSRDLPGLPTTGMTDKAERVLWVPLDEDGRVVSQHEMGHVLWSPATFDGKRFRVPVLFVRAVEDARVNLGLRQIGQPLRFPERLGGEVLRIARDDLRHDDVVSFTLRTVASLGTNVEPPLRALVAGDGEPVFATVRELVDETLARLERGRRWSLDPVPTFAHGVKVARWLAGEFKKRGFPEPQSPDGVLVGCCGAGAAAGHARGRGEGGRTVGRLADGVRPGRLRIVTPPLPERCAGAPARRGRRRRAAAEGVELRYMHRFPVDQSVFARVTRRAAPRGGSVLIDTSGSMNLTAQALDRIIAAAPEATLIAIYSGRGDVGELKVVARNGRRCAAAQLTPYGTGNIVDLPALKWLARQPAPRVWISDGAVTGSHDVPTDAITARCKRICEEAGIVRVRNVAGAVKALRGGGAAEKR
jgi:hypothetical protein